MGFAFLDHLRLDLRRILRSWRWRMLLPLAVAGVYLLTRRHEYGIAPFPGGGAGSVIVLLALGLAAIMVAQDLAGQIDRARFRAIFDATRTASLPVQTARILASALSIWLIGAAMAAWPFVGFWRWEDTPLWLPTLLYLFLVLLPWLWCCAALATGVRAWLGSEALSYFFAFLLLIVPGWFLLAVMEPGQLFSEASRHLGVLTPLSLLWRDAGVLMGWGLLGLAAAALRLRSPSGRTQHRQLRGFVGMPLRAVRKLWSGWRLLRPMERLTFLVALGAGVWAANTTGEYLRERWNSWERLVIRPFSVPAVGVPRLVERHLTVGEGEAPFRVELALLAPTQGQAQSAAFTFGDLLDVKQVERQDGTVSLRPSAPTLAPRAWVFDFEPPLSATTTETLTIHLEPTAFGRRAMQRAQHPRFASLSDFGPWYGEAMRLLSSREESQVTRQPTPLALELPDLRGREWNLGNGAAAIHDGPGRLRVPIPALPTTLFAARLETVSRDYDGLTIQFLVLPEQRVVAENLQTIYAPQFRRLARLFGPIAEPLTITAVPGATPSDPLVLPMAELDRLASLLPRYDHYAQPTAPQFEVFFQPIHQGLVMRLMELRLPQSTEPLLMQDALAFYLHWHALASGRELPFRRRLRNTILLPWDWVRPTGVYPFDIHDRDLERWQGSLFGEQRHSEAPSVPDVRRQALHHQLRGILGDAAWVAVLRDLWGLGARQPVSLADYQALAERHHGASLDEFFRQWVVEGVVPEYRLGEADVTLGENDETRLLEYTVSAKLENVGTGSPEVPVVLVTETDEITRRIPLEPGQEEALRFVVRDRPLFLIVDPEGWVPQRPWLDGPGGKAGHAQELLKNVREVD